MGTTNPEDDDAPFAEPAEDPDVVPASHDAPESTPPLSKLHNASPLSESTPRTVPSRLTTTNGVAAAHNPKIIIMSIMMKTTTPRDDVDTDDIRQRDDAIPTNPIRVVGIQSPPRDARRRDRCACECDASKAFGSVHFDNHHPHLF